MTPHNLTTCLRFADRRERDELQAEEHGRKKAKKTGLIEDIIFQLFHARVEATTQNVELAEETYQITIIKKSMETMGQTEDKTYRVEIIEVTETRKPELKTIYIDAEGKERDYNELTYDQRSACKTRRVASGGIDVESKNKTVYSQTFEKLPVHKVAAFLNNPETP